MPVEFTAKPDASKPSSPAPSAPDPLPEPKTRSEPQQALPTDRINFDNQLKLLRAYAAASNQGSKPASNEDVAVVVEMKASTVSLANNFFVKNGFLIRSGREYTPAKEVLEYKLAFDWDPNTATTKLAPLIERSWFGQALRAKLDLRSMDESEVISDLAQRANAGPEYRNQIRTIVDYLTASGMVSREGGVITLVRRRPNEANISPEISDERSAPSVSAPEALSGSDMGSLPFGQVGSIKFAVSINVDMTQMVQWDPQRISAFFTGLAQVIAAQKGGK